MNFESFTKQKSNDFEWSEKRKYQKKLFLFHRQMNYPFHDNLVTELLDNYRQIDPEKQETLSRLVDVLLKQNLNVEEIEFASLQTNFVEQILETKFSEIKKTEKVLLRLELISIHIFRSQKLSIEFIEQGLFEKIAIFTLNNCQNFQVIETSLEIIGNLLNGSTEIIQKTINFDVLSYLNFVIMENNIIILNEVYFLEKVIWVISCLSENSIKSDSTQIIDYLIACFEKNINLRKKIIKSVAKIIKTGEIAKNRLFSDFVKNSIHYSEKCPKLIRPTFILLVEFYSKELFFEHGLAIFFLKQYFKVPRCTFFAFRLFYLVLNCNLNETYFTSLLDQEIVRIICDFCKKRTQKTPLVELGLLILGLILKKINDHNYLRFFTHSLIGLNGLLQIWDRQFYTVNHFVQIEFLDFVLFFVKFTFKEKSLRSNEMFNELFEKIEETQKIESELIYLKAREIIKAISEEKSKYGNKQLKFIDKGEESDCN